ncbi:hypothetical protein RUM44_001482 [Polyplax serrata]|uniref:DNA excision repair protein ERCC-8 n=1 Tax=Polyplax serrata TaxID=468196 RepID=A0ABR1AK72_POLSC
MFNAKFYFSLLSGCSDGSIYIHDINNLTGRPQFTAKCIYKVVKNSDYTHRYSVECVSWYGDDSALFVTSGTDKQLKIWDANSMKSIEHFHSKGRIFHHDCSNSPTSNPIIAVASSLNFVELIDLRTGSSTHELRGHKSSILTCNWSPTEEYLLATGGIDKCIFLWDIRSSNSCLKILDKHNKNDNKGTSHSGYVNGLKFTSDGLFLVSIGTDNKMRLWETLHGCYKKQNCIQIKNEVKRNIQFAVTNNSKPSLVYIPSEGNIFVVEMLSGALINILNGHFHLVNCCYYRHMYQELYSGGNDRNILMWTAANEIQEERFSNENKQIKSPILRYEDTWSSDEN